MAERNGEHIVEVGSWWVVGTVGSWYGRVGHIFEGAIVE